MLGSPLAVAAGSTGAAGSLRADLDGKTIDLWRVADYFCEDFSYPQIHCYSSSAALEHHVATLRSGSPNVGPTSSVSTLSTTSVEYVTIYDYATFAGTYMYLSQDYTVLAGIGWNDRISSYIARNGESGHFYTDWFYLGSSDYFCCNEMDSLLYGFDNTFSSVHWG